MQNVPRLHIDANDTEVNHDSFRFFVLQLVGIGADGASVITGDKSGVIKRMQYTRPFCLGQHCAAHRCALVGKDLSDMEWVQETEQVRQHIPLAFSALESAIFLGGWVE